LREPDPLCSHFARENGRRVSLSSI